MRPSSRTAILEAAFRLAGTESGAVQITFDATAREAGVTKGGVQYHFRTRDELVLAVAEYVADRSEEAMLERLGKPREEATSSERVAAYVDLVAAGSITRADLAVYAESLADPAFAAPWNAFLERWFDLSDVADSVLRARLHAARLGADGLWVSLAAGEFPPPEADRAAVVAELLALTGVSR